MSKDARIERLPPQNIEAEEAVLGGLLIDSDAIIRVSTVLKPGDFYREKNGWIFGAALALHERHEPIDFLTVCDELERKGVYFLLVQMTHRGRIRILTTEGANGRKRNRTSASQVAGSGDHRAN